MHYSDDTNIPDHMLAALKRYLEHRIQPGSFLTAVLSNDLTEAVGRADDINIYLLPAYVRYCHNEIPSVCWSNPGRVRAWLNGGQSADAE